MYVGLVDRDDTAGSVRVNLDIGKACAFQKATLGCLDRLDCGTSCGGAGSIFFLLGRGFLRYVQATQEWWEADTGADE